MLDKEQIRKEAEELLYSWVESESLRGHCKAVGACMESYAKKYSLSEDEIDLYYVTGLLHDFDYEKFPDVDLHPKKGCKFLEENGWPKEMVEAILGHNFRTGVPRTSRMAKTLFAVDELSGLVVALARVRPGGFEGMTPKSVRKVMKKKDFAAKVDREEIRQGMEELGVEEDEHFGLVIEALKNIRKDLGF